MNEVSYIVSHDGMFLFRTEWDNDKERIGRAQEELRRAFPKERGFRIHRNSRSKVFESEPVAN